MDEILQQARQGSMAAIIQVMNERLAPAGVRTRALMAEGVLQILCEAARAEQLDQSWLIPFLREILEQLEPRQIRRVRINSRIAQEQQLVWLEEISRNPESQLLWTKEITLRKPNFFQQLQRDFNPRPNISTGQGDRPSSSKDSHKRQELASLPLFFPEAKTNNFSVNWGVLGLCSLSFLAGWFLSQRFGSFSFSIFGLTPELDPPSPIIISPLPVSPTPAPTTILLPTPKPTPKPIATPRPSPTLPTPIATPRPSPTLPTPVISPTPVPTISVATPVISPSFSPTVPGATPVVSPSPNPSPSLDPFAEAVRIAGRISSLGQKAQTKTEWLELATQWQRASELMTSVSQQDPRYNTARNRAQVYQRNSQFALQVASQKGE